MRNPHASGEPCDVTPTLHAHDGSGVLGVPLSTEVPASISMPASSSGGTPPSMLSNVISAG